MLAGRINGPMTGDRLERPGVQFPLLEGVKKNKKKDCLSLSPSDVVVICQSTSLTRRNGCSWSHESGKTATWNRMQRGRAVVGSSKTSEGSINVDIQCPAGSSCRYPACGSPHPGQHEGRGKSSGQRQSVCEREQEKKEAPCSM